MATAAEQLQDDRATVQVHAPGGRASFVLGFMAGLALCVLLLPAAPTQNSLIDDTPLPVDVGQPVDAFEPRSGSLRI